MYNVVHVHYNYITAFTKTKVTKYIDSTQQVVAIREVYQYRVRQSEP